MGVNADALDSILLDYAQDKITVVDEHGRFRYLNEAVERLLGYDPETLVGENAFEYIHPEDRSGARAAYEQVIDDPDPTAETVRYRMEAADGSWVWLESRFSNVTDDRIGGYVVSSRDVTAEVEARRERATAQRQLVETTEVVTDVVWIFSPDWEELLFANPAYEELYGQPVEELEADPTSFLDQIHPDDVATVEEAMERLSAGESVDLEYRVNPKTDYDTTAWIQARPVVQDGDVVRIVGCTRDVTDRKRRERQLAVMDNLLRHNLRNDLSIILGHAELIALEGNARTAERAELIREQGRALLDSAEKQRSIIGLLTEATLPERIDVRNALDRAVSVVHDEYPDLQVTVDCPDSIPALANREIDAALAELLQNAVKHHEGNDPEITVTVTRTEQQVHVEVRDSCPPIPEAEFRVLTGDKEMNGLYHGSGLGLWLVYWTVDLSDGLISFEHEGDGNVITVSLRRPPRDG